MKIVSRNYPNFEASEKIWDKLNTKIYIEFDEALSSNKETQDKYFQQIEEKIKWIENHRELILNTLFEEEYLFEGINEEIENQLSKKGLAKFDNGLIFEKKLSKEEFKKAIGVLYINFYINEEGIDCDFDMNAEPDYFLGHLATIELDYNNQMAMGGIN